LNNHFLRRAITALSGLLVLAACDLFEPVKLGEFSLRTETQAISQNMAQPICRALEDAGYIMPYGPTLSWYQFNVSQEKWLLNGPNGLHLTIPKGLARLFVMVDTYVPADLNKLPDAVTQQTVDQLAKQAQNIRRIVQHEATRQGIGPIEVYIRLWDLVSGLELEYGEKNLNRHEGPALVGTSNCEEIVGLYIGHSNGLNPQDRTPNRCPSLYVPN
jgi:hypothetical protein